MNYKDNKLNPKYSLIKLENNFQAVFWPLKGVRAVATSLWIKEAGGWYEEKPKKGTFHFLEHVLGQGTKSYPSFGKLSFREEELGINTNNNVGGPYSRYNWRFPKETFNEALELLSEYVFNPVFNNEGIGKEREIILQEYFDHCDSYRHRFFQNLLKNYWGESHPYGFDALGEEKIINSISRKDLIQAHQNNYSPEKMVLAIVGDLDKTLVLEKLERYFGKYGSNKGNGAVIALPKFSKKIFFQEENIKQVAFTCWFPLFKSGADDWKRKYTVIMLSYLFGGSRRSRLALLLREREPLAYSFDSRQIGFPEGKIFQIRFFSSERNVLKIIELLKKEIESIKINGFTQDEFLAARKFCLYQVSMSNDSIESIANNLINDLFWRGKIYLPENIQSEIKKITKEDLEGVVKEVFNFDKATIGLMGDQQNIKSLKPRLGQIL
jgi:predicted Zn-dependent peptidase